MHRIVILCTVDRPENKESVPESPYMAELWLQQKLSNIHLYYSSFLEKQLMHHVKINLGDFHKIKFLQKITGESRLAVSFPVYRKLFMQYIFMHIYWLRCKLNFENK